MRTAPPAAVALLLAGLATAACRTGGGGEPGPGPAPGPADARAAAVVAGQSAFAADLYGRVRGGDGNLLLSPYSVHAALSVLRLGARGETAARLDASLRLPAEGAEEGWTLLRAAVRGDADAALLVGNRLWIDDRFALDAGFAASAGTIHGATVRRRDLADAVSVSDEVNGWVREATRGMIPTAIRPGDVPLDAALVLVNAIFFHGKWQRRFDRAATRPEPFATASGARVEVPMMALTATFRYQEDALARTLALPYRGGTTELVVILPAAEDGLAALEGALTADTLARWTTGGAPREVDLRLPRLTYDADLVLDTALAALGLETLFHPRADDLGGVGSDPRGWLFLTRVKHAARLELDEEGTRAAAATVALGACSAPVEPPPIPFRCDRPFLFVIRHVPTGALLFLGRVVAPPT